MLGKLQALALIVRTALAIEAHGTLGQGFVDQASHRLAVFQQKRRLVAAHLQHALGADGAGLLGAKANWRTSWGGTNETVALPRAVRVDLVVAEADPSERSRGMMAKRTLIPFQLIVPILVTPSTNTTDTATDGGQP